MADDDNFDIDIYGDDAPETTDYQQQEHYAEEGGEAQLDGAYDQGSGEPYSEDIDIKLEHDHVQHDQNNHNDYSNDHEPAQSLPQQGVKRKEGPEDHALEPNATAALIVSELNWWTDDDDIRGWANHCEVEDQLTTITFHEHKVNGKSKGQVYIEFTSPQAASTVKHYVDNITIGPGSKKYTVEFHNPSTNPFRTLPKDAPQRAGAGGAGRGSTAGAYERPGGSQAPGYNSFRGGRGRGNFNRGGFGGGQPNAMGRGGFNTGMGMGGFNNFNGRGGMMGGRGGFNNFNRGGGMMMGMPMQMNPMNMNMGMGMGMGGFGGGQGHFNPAFFQNQQMGGGGAENNFMNPHGNKRARES